jgi:peptidoglycan/LPS O-acetylase OafA/YrhL
MLQVPNPKPQAPPIDVFGRSIEEWTSLLVRAGAVLAVVVLAAALVYWLWLRPRLRVRR